ncbi:hypothetical protein AAEX28_10635 [Lentisphaerota bacterium WC36G]|nr:hypothetical protein LJT99_13480 [Lentisphaerae bacterium WC36]
MYKVLILTILIFLVTGCTRYNESEIGYLNGVQGAIKYEPIVEFKDEKIEADVGLNILFWFIVWADDNLADEGMSQNSVSTRIGQLKTAAYYKACEKSDSDLLLAAKYKLESRDYFFFRKLKCQVQGYPANVLGIVESNNIKKR